MIFHDDDSIHERGKVKSAMPKPSTARPTTPSPLNGWHDLVIGQPQFADAVEPAIKRHLAGLGDPTRPVGVWLLAGPTGTGKTKSVEALAEVLHGSAKHIVRLDCGEFQQEHETAKLVGAPPGYLGHRETQPLLTTLKLTTAASTQCPITILLLDELEKAADAFHRLLLGIMDTGKLKLGDNTQVDFTRTLICATTNLAANAITRASASPLGFAGEARPQASADNRGLVRVSRHAARGQFPPEFLNRLDGIVAFRLLSRDHARMIAAIELGKAFVRPVTWAVECDNLDALVETIVEDGFSVEYGAREIKRSVERLVMGPLADHVWALDKAGLRVTVRIDDGQVAITSAHDKAMKRSA